VLGILRTIRDNIYSILIAALLAYAAFQKKRGDIAMKKKKELDKDVKTLEIKVDAAETRSRPVPDNKSDILDRM
jgi:hypothetical protein